MTPTARNAKLRTLFACLRAARISEDDRHALCAAWCGEPSTRAMSDAQLDACVASAQAAADAVAGRRSPAADAAPDAGALPAALDVGATRKQIALIEQLAVERMRHPDRLPELIRLRAFRKADSAMANQWSGSLATLPRDVASRIPKILLRIPRPDVARRSAADSPELASSEAPF